MLVEASELIKSYKNRTWQNNIIVLDASWYLPNQNRNAFAEYKNTHIPHALYFDIDKVCDIDSDLPHTVPTESQFENNMEELGINNKSHIIIYSRDGIGTSPRAWWLCKLFGHQNVSILNGGLKAWLEIYGPDSKNMPKVTKSIYKAKQNKDLLATHKAITDYLNSNEYQIVDASNNPEYTIEEENGWVKVADSLLGEIPVAGAFTGYLFNPSYSVTNLKGEKIARLKKQASFFGRKFQITKLGELDEGDSERIMLGLMMLILLERRRG